MHTSKDKVRCILVIATWQIEGDVHVLSDSRLTDTLNAKTKGFFAVTDAVVTDVASGRELFRPPYMAVNRDSIALVFPLH